MAKTLWILLLITCVISAASVGILIAVFSTREWIVSEAEINEAYRNSEISYGLFKGSLTRYTLSSGTTSSLSLVCSIGENKCAFSCQNSDGGARKDELYNLINGLPLASCPIITQTKSTGFQTYKQTINQTSTSDLDKKQVKFINAGIVISAIVFLAIAMLFAATSVFFSFLNVVVNPVEPIFSIFGLYIWNGITMAATLLVLILYGSLYATTLKENIGISDTLRAVDQYSSAGLANLGVSYWLLIVVFVLHGINLVLIYLRKELIDKEPPAPVIVVEKNDSTLMLY